MANRRRPSQEPLPSRAGAFSIQQLLHAISDNNLSVSLEEHWGCSRLVIQHFRRPSEMGTCSSDLDRRTAPFKTEAQACNMSTTSQISDAAFTKPNTSLHSMANTHLNSPLPTREQCTVPHIFPSKFVGQGKCLLGLKSTRIHHSPPFRDPPGV